MQVMKKKKEKKIIGNVSSCKEMSVLLPGKE